MRYLGPGETGLTGLKGVFWENGVRDIEEIGCDRIKDCFESQAEEFKFNMGILEAVKSFEHENVLRGNGI